MAVSDFFGNLSQIFWLFAQVPQIWKNYQLKSVDGISFPFLMSWFSGDITNLIGCILTNQLPFQRNLAIYFNFIDVVLLLQYGCYSRFNLISSFLRTINNRYRALFFGDDDNHHHHHHHHHHNHHQRLINSSEDDEEDEVDSISHGKHWDNHKYPKDNGSDLEGGRFPSNLSSKINLKSDSPTSNAFAFDPAAAPKVRGRSLRRTRSTDELDPDLPIATRPKSMSPTAALSSDPLRPSTASRSSKLAAPVIFLGAFAFLAINTPSSKYSYFNQIPLINSRLQSAQAWSGPESKLNCSGSDSPSSDCNFGVFGLEENSSSWQDTIGRLSSWICTGFYLSSRMPQIIKNHRRKSVEGLSILLFIMAFLGNLTYVFSVLTSPEIRTEPGFLKNSIPYLLGSGGTLCFDMMIYVQSQLYSKPSSSSLSSPVISSPTNINDSSNINSHSNPNASNAATALAINGHLRKPTSRNNIRLSQENFSHH